MSNSQKDKLEDVLNENKESIDENLDSTSNKKTRFTKSKSISEVFRELDSEDTDDTIKSEDLNESHIESNSESNIEFNLESDSGVDSETNAESNIGTNLDSKSVDSGINSTKNEIDNYEDILYESDMDSIEEDSFVDEIIPIHNEYKDLDKSEVLDDISASGEDIENIVLESSKAEMSETDVKESNNFNLKESSDSKVNKFNKSNKSIDGNIDSIGGDLDSIGSDDFKIDDNDSFVEGKSSDKVLNEEDSFEGKNNAKVLNEKSSSKANAKSNKQNKSSKRKNKSSSDEDLLKEYKSKDSGSSFELDSSLVLTIIGFIVGIGILVMGIVYLGTSSDRVVDNVLSGETAGLAVFLIIIGLIIAGFSVLRFLTSSDNAQSSSVIDMFNNIKKIDYDDVNEDSISRDDFEAVFSNALNKNKNSNFSDKKGSVDKNSNLFEDDDLISDKNNDSRYSKSRNNGSQTKTSSSKQQNLDNSTEDSKNSILTDNSLDIEDSSNSGDDIMADLKDKYAKYKFDDDEDNSKPKFKKSVDISKFDENLSEEELEAQKKKKKEELVEKKRRIIQGTNFDNNLRK